jgi:predicted dehydrogenase
MGAGIQTRREAIDQGKIGQPIGATAFMMCPGHESWHPDPEFYYKVGGGPMLDMGPYYVTALINLLGPVRKVSGMAKISRAERTITSEKKNGQKIKVETHTHIQGMMEFAGGAIGTIITSFDVTAHQMPWVEIYGTEGTLRVPDPNCFGGEPLIGNGKSWEKLPLTFGFAENSRGVGVSDMANALLNKKNYRPKGELAFHALDIMQSFIESSDSGRAMTLASTCAKPDPMPKIAAGKEYSWTE